MSIKSEISNALQLFLLLCLLYWTLTWNLPPNFDDMANNRRHRDMRKSKSSSKGAEVEGQDSIQYWNKHFLFLESFQKGKHVNRRVIEISLSENSIIPSFNEWKKEELTKKERSEKEKGDLRQKHKPTRRKLNYSSSKCGAKVLASNSEAKHRMAILNEKADEYMLNPCNARSWFVIEMCDTIEATQIELANYELYSSSPKGFSVFWSDIFPTQVWHHLGSFEATNQRIMQSFNVTARNLGKFLKVVIFSHHGKEHYCPLSVIRILGYSMVYEFEEMEDHTKSKEDLQPNNISSVQQPQNRSIEKGYKLFGKGKPSSLAAFSQFCSRLKQREPKGKCSNLPFCQLLNKLMAKSRDKTCVTNVSQDESRGEIKLSSVQTSSKNKFKFGIPQCSIAVSSMADTTTKRSLSFQYSSVFDIFYLSNLSNKTYTSSAAHKRSVSKVKNASKYYDALKHKKGRTKNTSKIVNTQNENHSLKHEKNNTLPTPKKECHCEKKSENSRGERESNSYPSAPSSHDMEYDLDSAGLIQKESVLIKLTTRIKIAEANLDLINKYLQQLSQSYRQQMEDMQINFNETVKVVTLASEKAEIIDKKQEMELGLLQNKMIFLNSKMDYIISGQKDSLKLMMELHGFFLVLQLTIISTVFTIVLNNLRQKCSLAEKVILNSKREQLYYKIVNSKLKYGFSFK